MSFSATVKTDEVTMRRDSDAVNVPACFISNHEGFLGTIKNLIKDFVVTEIDISGQRVNTAAATQTLACASSDKFNKTSAEFKQSRNYSVSQDTDDPADCGVDVTVLGKGTC